MSSEQELLFSGRMKSYQTMKSSVEMRYEENPVNTLRLKLLPEETLQVNHSLQRL